MSGHGSARRASYSRRQHELLERSNAEGRTRVRCRWCRQPIDRGPRGAWITDDDLAECQARIGAVGYPGHLPPA